jgi:hypothetical protein
MSLELDRVYPMSLKEINATTKFLKWTDLKARIQDATI